MPFFIVWLHPGGPPGRPPRFYWIQADNGTFASAEEAADVAEQYRFLGNAYTVTEAISEAQALSKVMQNWPRDWPAIPDAARRPGLLGYLRDIVGELARFPAALLSALRHRFREKTLTREALESAKRQHSISRRLNEHRAIHPSAIARPYSCARCAELLTTLHRPNAPDGVGK